MSDQYWQDESGDEEFEKFIDDIMNKNLSDVQRKFLQNLGYTGQVSGHKRREQFCPHKNAQDLDLRANLRYCPDCGRVI